MINQYIKAIRPLGFPWATQDPFIFCAYHYDLYPNGNEELGPDASLVGRRLGQDFDPGRDWRMYHGESVPGFPHHPHSGFETVTIAKKGLVDHADSLGAAGRFGNGDVQWMTAGKGVQHSEMFPLLNQEEGNPLELFQIWLNLPSTSKKVDPHFAMLWSETIPTILVENENGRRTEIDVMAGVLNDVQAPDPAPNSWAANPDNEVAIWTIRMSEGASWELPAASAGVNRSLYFYRGQELQIEGQKLSPGSIIDLQGDLRIPIQNLGEEAHLLFLQGKPINEPLVQHGPFVANSQEGMQEIFREYQRTQFGGWPWPRPDQVHDRSRGRFALHMNGQEEVK